MDLGMESSGDQVPTVSPKYELIPADAIYPGMFRVRALRDIPRYKRGTVGGDGEYSGAATVSCPSMETMRDFLHAVGREDGVEYAFSKYARKVIVQWGKLRIRAIYES